MAVDIRASARKHDISDEDMIHAYDNAFAVHPANPPANTMYIGPSRSGAFIEVGVVEDDDGDRIIHAMPARKQWST